MSEADHIARQETGERTSCWRISAHVLARIQIFYSILVFLIFAGILVLSYETGKKDFAVNLGNQQLTDKENIIRRKYNQGLIWCTLLDFYTGLFMCIFGVMYGIISLQGAYQNKPSGSLTSWVFIWSLFLILIGCSLAFQHLFGLGIQCSTLFLAFYGVLLLIIRSIVIKSENIRVVDNGLVQQMVGQDIDRNRNQQRRRSLGEEAPPPYHSLFPSSSPV